MNTLAVILAMALLAFLALFAIPYVMTRRATRKLVTTFRAVGAVSEKSARTPEELGLAPVGFFDRMMKPRDYRPQALRLMRETGVVRSTTDGRFYLSERASQHGSA